MKIRDLLLASALLPALSLGDGPPSIRGGGRVLLGDEEDLQQPHLTYVEPTSSEDNEGEVNGDAIVDAILANDPAATSAIDREFVVYDYNSQNDNNDDGDRAFRVKPSACKNEDGVTEGGVAYTETTCGGVLPPEAYCPDVRSGTVTHNCGGILGMLVLDMLYDELRKCVCGPPPFSYYQKLWTHYDGPEVENGLFDQNDLKCHFKVVMTGPRGVNV